MTEQYFQRAGIDQIELPNITTDHITVLDKIDPIETKKITKNALQYDIKMGWKPRSQITGPIPLSFSSQRIDLVLQQKFNDETLIYLGYRPINSFSIHKEFYQNGNKYPYHQFHLFKSKYLKKYFKKKYSEMQFQQYRQEGMKQGINNNLMFNSHFQGGNLDAVYLQGKQYRLLLRNDSNTLGHCNFYNFKIKAINKGEYIFRIMNMSKKKSLYERGLKPYVRVLSKRNSEWQQKCINVKYGQSPLNEQFEFKQKFYSLKFSYTFCECNQEVQFCYGIPYVYSDLILKSDQLKFQYNNKIHLTKLCYSLSGVQIPLLSIGNFKTVRQQNHQNIIIITGRVHPGQTHSSHIINGIIDQLLNDNKQSNFLRENVIFKIIPMLNPDGVIIGNTRTSFAGKDMNRKYSENTEFIFPQIIALKDYILKCKNKYKDKLLFIIDIHAHSLRKNSFFYGPQYPITKDQYMKCRIFPKMYSNRTNMFRYYSCKFKISNGKEQTARGYFNKKKIKSYTHETSMYCYYDHDKRSDCQFTQNKLNKLGKYMVKAIYDYVAKFNKIEKKHQNSQLELKSMIKEEAVQQNDSDEISSNGADSQDSNQDLSNNKLQQLNTLIKTNKQQFCKDLLMQEDLTTKQIQQIERTLRICKNLKCKIKQQIQQQQQQQQIIETIDLKQDRIKAKINNHLKIQFNSEKKKKQEFTKLSNVIFGSTLCITPFRKQFIYSEKIVKKLMTKKKSEKNLKLMKISNNMNNINNNKNNINNKNNKNNINNINNNKQDIIRNKTKQIISNEMIQKDIKNNIKINQMHQNFQKQINIKIKKKQFQQEKQIYNNKSIIKQTNINNKNKVMKLLSTTNQFNIIKTIPQSLQLLHNDIKQTNQIFNITNSLKFLTRKKSIKATRKSVEYNIQKNNNNKKIINPILAKKLPSLDILYSQY